MEKEKKTELENKETESNVEFDASKFLDSNIENTNNDDNEKEVIDDKNNKASDKEVENENQEEDDKSDENVWSFDDEDTDIDNDSSEQNEDVNNADKTELDNEDRENDNEENNSFSLKSISKKQFEEFAEEIGLTIKDPKEFRKAVQELEDENIQLREQIESGSVVVESDVVKRLKNLKDKSDEELIRMDLKKQGFNELEIDESVDTYIDSGLLKIEGKKIRNTIDKAIENENKKTFESKQLSEAKQKEEVARSVKALSEHIKKTDTMFGYKIAKDEKSLEKVQKQHIDYITSGKFLGDITKDEMSTSEAAWLWKNRDTIFKALKNSGSQKAKEELLNDLSNPNVESITRFKGPDSKDGFDPKKFVYGK